MPSPSSQPSPRRRHPLNVPGDFYVADECCTTCAVPMQCAPNLFRWAVKAGRPDHCYVSKQPKAEREVQQMIDAMDFQEFECIRYGGADPAMLDRLRRAGVSALDADEMRDR